MANFDLYQTITDRIISELENGIIPWHKPWVGGTNCAISHETGRAYSMLNQILLGNPGEYITFTQCKKEGGKVKKGAKAKMIVFWKMLCVDKKNAAGETITDADGKAMTDTVPVLKYFNVFHISDCEGIEPKPSGKLPAAPADPVENAEKSFQDYLTRSGVRFESSVQDRAFYSPSADLISCPAIEQFSSSAEYYSTIFHEATHSTGHKSRLNRFPENAAAAAFGSESYSKEELVAELGAAAILNNLGIETASSFRNSAAYIQSWLRALKDDKRLIVSASARAEKAMRLILNLQEA